MATTKTSAKMNMDTSACNCNCMCHTGPGLLVVKIIGALVLPLLLIWSLNRLFFAAAPIMYTTYTWFAALVIILIFSGKSLMRKRCWGCGMAGCNCSMGMTDSKK